METNHNKEMCATNSVLRSGVHTIFISLKPCLFIISCCADRKRATCKLTDALLHHSPFRLRQLEFLIVRWHQSWRAWYQKTLARHSTRIIHVPEQSCSTTNLEMKCSWIPRMTYQTRPVRLIELILVVVERLITPLIALQDDTIKLPCHKQPWKLC